MAYIDKLLNKFNNAKSKLNSVKGIASDIQSIKYDSVQDFIKDKDLGSETFDRATGIIDERNTRLKNQISGAANRTKHDLKSTPKEVKEQLIYPFHDALSNYIVFNIRPRRQRTGQTKLNVHDHQSIALYIPDTLISQANVSYRSQGIGIFSRSILDVLKTFSLETLGDNAEKLFQAGLATTANRLSGGLLNVSQGVALNPQNEQLFDNLPFRSWDFTFDFYAKSTQEANQIRSIIYTFRSAMLPDVVALKVSPEPTKKTLENGQEVLDFADIFDTNEDGEVTAQKLEDIDSADDTTIKDSIRPFFNLPNVFDIKFHGPVGNHIDGFLPAVCSNVQVDYTGGQKFSTHVDGQPMHVQMTLQFLELKIMTLNNYETIRAPSAGVKSNIEQYDDSLINNLSNQIDNPKSSA